MSPKPSQPSRPEYVAPHASSPWRYYSLSFIASFAVVLALSGIAFWNGYNLAGSGSIFIKEWLPSYAAAITLLLGLPTAFASSVALVRLADATVSATREAPQLDQAAGARTTIIELHDAFEPLVASLNMLDGALNEWERAASELNPADLREDEDDPSSCLTGHRFVAACDGLNSTVRSVAKAFEAVARHPLARASLKMAAAKPGSGLHASEARSSHPALEAMVAFPSELDVSAPALEFKAARSRYFQYLDVYEDGSGQLAVDEEGADRNAPAVSFRLPVGNRLAVAGLSSWEVSPARTVVPSIEDDERLVCTLEVTASEKLMAATFLHDVILSIPGEADVVAAASQIATLHGGHVSTGTMLSATIAEAASIYASRQFLSDRLLEAATEFGTSLERLKIVVGSRAEEDEFPSY